jgi:integrase
MSDQRVTVYVLQPKDRTTLQLQWVDPGDGKRRTKSAGTADPDEAERKRADLEYELNNGRYQEASRMTWERFRELFEAEYLPNVRPGTRGCYTNAMNLFEKVCNLTSLRAINERTISAFATGLRKLEGTGRNREDRTGMQSSTIQARLRELRVVLNWATSQKLIPECPTFPSVKAPKKKPQPVATEAFERIFEKAAGDQQLQAFLLCGWLAGLRLNEAFSLEREPTEQAPYLALDRNRIILPAEFVKADEDQWVPLDPALRQALDALPRHGKKVFRFFDGRRPGQNIPVATENTVGQRIIRLAKRAGVKLTMRTLRRGFGCRYAGKVPAQVLQKLMRHSNISITMDYYANVDQAVEEAVLGKQLPNVLPNTAPAAGSNPSSTPSSGQSAKSSPSSS